MTDKTKRSTAKKVISIVGAWLTLPLLGIALLWFSTLLGYAVTGAGVYSDTNFPGSVMLNGLVGLLILAIIILAAWRFKKKTYFFHLYIGLWIGVGIYAIILASGVSAYYSTQANVAVETTCSTALDKYQKSSAAIVPIETNIGFGTGFIVDDKGTVLTANHVVENSTELYANYASGKVSLTILDQAPEYDLAVLKLDRYEADHFSLSDSYNVGDQVYAYGYPGNAYTAGAPSLSGGIVSRILTTADLRLTNNTTPDGYELIQTDAAINGGNSGGPLIGSCGVVGVISSVSDSAQLSDYVGAVSEQGIGYAVSIKAAAQRFNLPLVSAD